MKNFLFKLLTVLFFIFSLSSCEDRLSNSELSEEVKRSMVENGISGIKSFYLTREGKESNKYKGILKTTEPNGDFTYTVDVIYDGEAFTWEVKN